MPARLASRVSPLGAVLLFAACDQKSPPPSTAPPPALSSVAPSAAPPPDDAGAILCPKRYGPQKLAWSDEAFRLVFDAPALSCLSDAERAAVAYVAATLGTECEWAPGTDLAAPEHMDCKLTTALGLGYQCETKHKAFLVTWLGDDIPAQCARVPITAFSQTALNELSLRHDASTIVVTYEAVTTTGPGGEAWTWSETIAFQEKGPGALKVAHRKTVKNGARR